MQRRVGVGLGLALLSAASFGTSGAFARSLIDAGWSPGAAVTARLSVAALALVIPTVVLLRGKWHILRRNAGIVTVYGLVAVAGCQFFYFNAVEHLSVGVALLLEYLGTVLIVGWLWAFQGQRPRKLTALGALVAIGGLALVLDLTGDSKLDPIGVLWGLAAAVGLAVFFVLSARIDPELPPIAVAGAGMGIGALALGALGLVGLLPMRATFGDVDFAGTEVSWLVPVLGLSLVAAVVAYVIGIGAARALGEKLASFIGLTEVMFAVLIAWVLLAQLPSLIQLAGGVLIVGGIILVHIDEMRGPKQPLTSETGLPSLVDPDESIKAR